MTLSDHQYRYTNSSGDTITVGDGTDVGVFEIDGLEGHSARVGDRELPRGHGSVPGAHYQAARQVLLGLQWAPPSGESTDARWEDIAEAFAVETGGQGELVWKQPDRPERMIRCRPIMLPRRVDNASQYLASTKVALLAADPRIYSSSEHSVSVPLYTPSGGGLNFPLNFPLNFAAGGVVDVVATNNGDADAYPTVRFHGPASGTCTGVVLSNRTTGVDVDISATITSGQILTFDAGAYITGSGEMVVGLDGSSRYGDWTQPRTPLALQPGDNVLRFTITGTATAMTAVVTFRDTWLA